MKTQTPKFSPKWSLGASGTQRREVLMERISAVSGSRHYYKRVRPVEPPHVKRARAVVAVYEEMQEKIDKQQRQEVETAARRARTAVLFAEAPEKAIAVVEALEKLAKQRKW